MDRETGDVTIHRHITVSDVGKALNPLQVRMQDEGAAIMGLGHTLMEQYILDDGGRIRNLGAIDYRIPTSLDVPDLVALLVESNDPEGPRGAKEAGEGPLHPSIPAIANAIFDAVGVRIDRLPFTPARVLAALREKRAREQKAAE